MIFNMTGDWKITLVTIVKILAKQVKEKIPFNDLAIVHIISYKFLQNSLF